MPPPAIAKAEARLQAEKDVGTGSPNKDENSVQETTRESGNNSIDFYKFPAEIQDMIWAEALLKPAAHSFKYVWYADIPWYMEIYSQPAYRDHSAYRKWKSILWNSRLIYDPSTNTYEELKPGRSHPSVRELPNASFQAGFRRAMVDFESWRVLDGNCRIEDLNYGEKAAIDKGTDLAILEFDRGVRAPALHWFEHSTGRIWMGKCREETKRFKRVAVHYKGSHIKAKHANPFQCYCPEDDDFGCGSYKACPLEQACFLDCLRNLEEFYYVVEVRAKKDIEWMQDYRDHLRRNGCKLKESADATRATFEVARFYDLKFAYIQLCPKGLWPFLPDELQRKKPLRAMAEGGARECLVKVMQIYKGFLGEEKFINSLERRKKVKFGILFAYKLDKWN